MSGPKIVDIRVLQAQRERQLRLLRERIAYQHKQWELSRQRLQVAINELADQADGQTVKTIEAAVQQIEQRFQSWPDDTDLEQLLQLSEAQLRFIEQETQELKEQLTRQLADSRQGQRSLQLAIADAASRLERAGLGAERDELLAQATSVALEAALDRLTAAAVEERDGALAAATTELVGSIKPEKIDAGPIIDTAGERVGRLLVQLELLGESSQIAGFAQRLEDLVLVVDGSQRRLLTDSLALEIDAALSADRVEQIRQASLSELEAELAIYPAAPPALIEQLHNLKAQPKAVITEVGAAVRNWCDAEAQRQDGEQIRSLVLGSLRELGYDVREGMATAWAEGGQLMLQKPGSRDYGVELQDVSGRVRTQVVRFGDPAADPTEQQKQRDVEVEQQWCTAHSAVLKNLQDAGLEAKILASRAIGELPLEVRAVDSAMIAEQRNAATTPAAPNQRQTKGS
ncbi:hypothetical protein KBY83_13350 [Cyanobium sp. WKJ7-Wakatipu]|uniref:hypothetical protein n=1 Tax=Cyanobium sp. WKJ7-Wakatipu TaxID=2823726 RepID=UPI0020CCB549|nr:hypothetical protein [Cyanobium sp. WKJ7-Wakatipu]MCP9784285.1 hypothetical protein [Cyanobium sp. WKJ7-Wakatipu]